MLWLGFFNLRQEHPMIRKAIDTLGEVIRRLVAEQ